MTRAHPLLNDTLVLAFGSLAGRVVGILLLPLYTYTLSRTEFGTAELITTAVDLTVPLIFLCLSEAVLRFVMASHEATEKVIYTAVVFVGLGIGLAVAAAAVASLWWSPRLTGLIASVLILQVISSVLGAWSRAVGEVRLYAISGVAQALGMGVAGAVFLLHLDEGVLGYLLSLCVGLTAGSACLLARLPLVATMRAGAFDAALLHRMLAYSVPLIPNLVLWWLTNISGRFFVAHWSGIDEVGLFGVAARISAAVVMVTTVFAQAWQRAANLSMEADDQDHQERFFSTVCRFYIAFLVIITSLMIVAVRPLVSLATSPEFFEAWRIVPPMLGGAALAGLAAFFGTIYTAKMESKRIFRTTLVAGVVVVFFNVTLIPRWGAVGAASAILLAFAALCLIRVVDTRRLVRVSLGTPGALLALLALTTQCALQYATMNDYLRLALSGSALVFIVALFRREVTEGVSIVRRTAPATVKD